MRIPQLSSNWRFHFLFLILFGVASSAIFGATSVRTYPTIQESSFELRLDVANSSISNSKEIVIRDRKGAPAYRFGVYTSRLGSQTITKIDFELEGMGSSATRWDSKYEPNLLNPDRWGHGEGRWEVSPVWLCDANKNDREWGARRVFILRRMRIEVRISDVEFGPQFLGITRARIEVRITPSGSTRSRPADIPYKEPTTCS